MFLSKIMKVIFNENWDTILNSHKKLGKLVTAFLLNYYSAESNTILAQILHDFIV